MKIVFVMCLAAVAGAASAERADSYKLTTVDARMIDIDQITGLSHMVGNVELKRGTMAMAAAKADVQEAPDGMRYMVLTAAPGQFATFRQRSDAGPEVWTEARAQRIEYDERTDVVKLFRQATVKSTDHGLVRNQIDGELLTINDRSQIFTAINNANGVDTPNGGRSTATFAARKVAPAAAAPAAVASPAPAATPAPAAPLDAPKPR